jgi:hypothetical protein
VRSQAAWANVPALPQTRPPRQEAIVLGFLARRQLRKVEGLQFTLRKQQNSQRSVRVLDDVLLPMSYRRVELKVDGVRWETGPIPSA